MRPIYPLTDLIQPYLNTKLHDIPDEIRNRICAEDTFSLWDFLSPEQRCKWAANIDYEEDPNREDERKRDWDITFATLQTEDEIKRCEGLNTHGIPSEEKIKKAMLAELKNKLAELNEQWNTTLPGLHEAEQKAWKAEHNALSDEEVKARHEVGRYTLEEAAKIIQDNTPMRSNNFILNKMEESAGTELEIYWPGTVQPYIPRPRVGAVWVERDYPPKNYVPTWYVEAFWNDLNAWLENKSECKRIDYRFPKPNTPAPTKSEAVPDTSPSGDDWRVKAREIADECFDHDTKATPSVRDSLATKNVAGQIDGGYCFRVMGIMQKRGIKGPRGIINNPGTIMREALQAKKWWANKKK